MRKNVKELIKKGVAYVLAGIMLFSGGSWDIGIVKAATTEYNDGTYKYTDTDGVMSITGLVSGKRGSDSSPVSVTIPSSYNGTNVTIIGDSAFSAEMGTDNECYVSSVNFASPSNVKSIGNGAFACSLLTSISLPNSVTIISDRAFNACSSLSSVSLSDNLQSIGANAFEETGISKIEIPSGVATIGANAFYKCSYLTDVTIPASVTSIGANAFDNSANLTIHYIKGCTAVEKYLETNTSIKGDAQESSGVKVSSITLNESTLSLGYGSSYQLTATVSPSNAENKNVSWSTSDPERVSVDQTGKVTAALYGSAGSEPVTITALAQDGSGASATCSVTPVFIDPESIAVSPSTKEMKVGDKVSLTATVTPSNATNTPYWTSNNTNVATVDDNGVVTAVGTGQTYIYANVAKSNSTVVKGSCVVTVSSNVTTVAVTGITISGSSSVYAGDTTTFTAEVSPSNATNKAVTWSSSNPSVATVNSSGVVTGVATGTAVITATAQDGSEKSATKTITVAPKTVAVTGITLSTAADTLSIGDTMTISATVAPSNATNKTLAWGSSNTSIATVSSSGVVTGVAAGTAIITATAQDGSGITSSVSITVKPVMVTNVTLSADNTAIDINKTCQIKAGITPAIATNKELTWSSSNESVATVNSSGLVTGKAAGTAVIRATAKDGSEKYDEWSITVNPILVTKIELKSGDSTADTISIDTGDTCTITATVTPSNATLKTVTWDSSKPGVAKVDSSGLVTAVSPGTATITATADDASKTKGVIYVTVNPVKVKSIALSMSKTKLDVGGTCQINATVKPDNATDKNLNWTSSDDTILTVSASGLVTAVAPGEASITATAHDGSGVNGTISVEVNKILVTGIEVSPSEITIKAGESQSLTALVTPASATDPAYRWSSNNQLIATVDDEGKVIGVREGTVVISATSQDGSGISGTCQVTVLKDEEQETPEPEIIYATGISLDATGKSLKIGESFELHETILPDNASLKTVLWESTNPTVAAVDNGVVTAKKSGTAVIKASTQDGTGKTAVCNITVVSAVKVTKIELSSDKDTYSKGDSGVVTAVVTPVDATNKKLSWTTSDASVVSVDDNGNITAVASGTAYITAAAVDGSGINQKIQITVAKTSVSSINVTPAELTLKLGGSGKLEAAVLPADADNKLYNWSSDDLSVAQVDDKGNVKAVGKGETLIKASTPDGTVYGTCSVKVEVEEKEEEEQEEEQDAVLVSTVNVTPGELSLKVGEDSVITVEILPDNADNKEYKFSVDNGEIIGIDADGRVTAKAVGLATITVYAMDGSEATGECIVTVTEADKVDSPVTPVVPVSSEVPAAPASTEAPKQEDAVVVGSSQSVASQVYKVISTSQDGGTVEFSGTASKNSKSVSVPAKVTINGKSYKVVAVSASAFTNNKKIKSVTIGTNVTSIGANAFKGCKNLKKITIKSKNLKKIAKNAFKGINKKAVIKCPNEKCAKKYKKLFTKKTGYVKTMKIK